jgi:hypothetical protein
MSTAVTDLEMERHEKALMNRYNLAVFPTALKTKKPMCEHGFHDATRDIKALRMLHGGRPHGLAIATGAVSGIWALDVDVKQQNGKRALEELENANAPLSETWTVETPSGGLHFYFAWTDVTPITSRVNVFPGIDTRGAGGYVVAPPTTDYRWLKSPSQVDLAAAPEWLISTIMEQQRSNNSTNSVGLRGTPQLDVLGYTVRNQAINVGSRNVDMATFVRKLYKHGLSDEEVYVLALDHNNQRNYSTTLQDREVERIVTQARIEHAEIVKQRQLNRFISGSGATWKQHM